MAMTCKSQLRLLTLCHVMALLTLSVRAEMDGVPWQEGETLEYEIHWGMIPAAEAKLTAKRTEDTVWELSLALNSVGLVNTVHPLRVEMNSIYDHAAGQSRRFIQDRREKKTESGEWDRIKQYTITFDHASGLGQFTDPNDGRDIQFKIESEHVQDLLSMAYFARSRDWSSDKPFQMCVMDRYKKEDQAVLQVIERKNMSLGNFPKQRIMVIHCRKIYPEENKKDGIWSRVWVTDDQYRIPLRAQLKMKFGSLTLRLKQHPYSATIER